MQQSHLRILYQQRDLLWAWTMRTIRARYKQSALGGLWAIIQPATAAIIFSVIFTYFVPIDTEGVPYLLFSYTAMVPWTLLTTSTGDMVDSLIANMNLVSKIYFPREVLPVAALLARLLDFSIASAVLTVLIFFFRVPIVPALLLYLPVILAAQLALMLGVGLIGAALNVFYRDVRHVVALGLQIWLYASPIIYPVDRVPERFRSYYFLNPMAGIIESYRDVLLYQKAPEGYLFIAVAIAATVLAFGYWLFKRLEFQFADVV